MLSRFHSNYNEMNWFRDPSAYLALVGRGRECALRDLLVDVETDDVVNDDEKQEVGKDNGS